METSKEGSDSVCEGRSTGKRKADGAPEERPAAKKRHGGLQFVEMPKAVLFKIFAHLEPLDLLHLARTTKNLRKSLMTRWSAPLWKTARLNVPGPQSSNEPSMPDRPPDLSEPQYADLLFGKDCSFCGKICIWRRRTMQTRVSYCPTRDTWVSRPRLWAARLRSCAQCQCNDTHFISKDDCKPSKDCPADLIRWLPSTKRRRDLGVPINIKTLWEEEYKKAKKKKDWLTQNQERQKLIATHAAACEAWVNKLPSYRVEADDALFEQRQAAVVEYIEKLGWGEELSKLSEWDKPQDSYTVRDACRQPLCCSRLENFINQFMEDAKENRLIKEREIFITDFKQEYESFIATLPLNIVYPVISDVLQDPVIRRIIGPGPGPLTPVAKTNFVSLFSSVGRRWQRTIEDKLIGLVASACADEHGPAPEIVIDLATTWFTCSKCDTVLRYPLVLMHDCATHVDADWEGAGLDADWPIVRRLFQRVPWNSFGYITFNRTVLASVTKVLEICHVDPTTTTAQEMDRANHILECNDPHEGRPTMIWSRMVYHWHYTHAKKGVMKVELLDDSEKTLVQAQISETQARRAAKRDYNGLVCSHCRLTGNMVDLTKHLGACRGRVQPTDKDIVPVVNEDHPVPDIYWLWPPREEPAPTPGLAISGDGLPMDEDDMYL